MLGQATRVGTAPASPRNILPIFFLPLYCFPKRGPTHYSFPELTHPLSLSILPTLNSSGNLSQKALSLTLPPSPSPQACSTLPRETNPCNLSSTLPFHPPAITELFLTPLNTHFLGGGKLFIIIGSASASSLTLQLLATYFSSYFSSEADPSKATSNPPVERFNDLLFSLHLGKLLATFGISTSYFLNILCSSDCQYTPLTVILIPQPWPPPPSSFDCSSSLSPLHSILQSPILGLFFSFNFVFSRFQHLSFCGWLMLDLYLSS